MSKQLIRFKNDAKKIRNWATGKDEDYTKGCLLDYKYIKHHYRLIAVDLSRQKQLYTDPKEIQQIEIVIKLKSSDNQIADHQSMFVLTLLSLGYFRPV